MDNELLDAVFEFEDKTIIIPMEYATNFDHLSECLAVDPMCTGPIVISQP
jgi:hypothetical protein